MLLSMLLLLTLSVALYPAGACGGPRKDLRHVEGAADDYVQPGRQVVLADTLHEFTDCGQISQWSMIFSCTASSDGSGYPIELQVFKPKGSGRRFRLISRAQVILKDEQCESQPVTFDVSMPFCQGDYVGMYIPDLNGLTGLGYRQTGNYGNVYLEKESSAPLSVDEKVSFSSSDFNHRTLPLVSVEGMLTINSALWLYTQIA